MASFRSILAVISDTTTAERVLTSAADLLPAGGRLEALHVKVDPTAAYAFMGENTSGAMMAEVTRLAQEDSEETASQLREIFDTFCIRRDVRRMPGEETGNGEIFASWREETGQEEELIAQRGRAFDLVILPRPRTDRPAPSFLTLNAALSEGGVPVMAVPRDASRMMPPARIGVAWNGSPESARAVSSAMGLLKAAEEVVILSIGEADETLAPSADIAARIARHGIVVRRENYGGDGSRTGNAILDAVSRENLELVVMGAYTHSRLRRLIMGGVTRTVLEGTPVPLLLSH